MPYYEYQGKTYDIATDNPDEAKVKILNYLGTSKIEEGTGEEFGAGELAQMALPAGMPTQTIIQPSGFAKYPPTGLGRLATDVAVPAAGYAKSAVAPIIEGYKTKPFVTGAIDVATGALTGAPLMSAFKGIMGLEERFRRGKEALGQMGENLQKTASSADIVPAEKTGTLMYEGQPQYKKVWNELNKVDPNLSKQLTAITTGPGGGTAAAKFLQSPEIQGLMEGNKEFAKYSDEFIKTVPTSRAAQALQLIKPFGRAAARVAGPVGLGMDVYDASQYARESNLGPRLAQGQGRQAQQAFRGMNQTYGPIAPDQAQAVLESGSERDIAAFGGRDKLSELIRLKAAERVLGPIAPGQ